MARSGRLEAARYHAGGSRHRSRGRLGTWPGARAGGSGHEPVLSAGARCCRPGGMERIGPGCWNGCGLPITRVPLPLTLNVSTAQLRRQLPRECGRAVCCCPQVSFVQARTWLCRDGRSARPTSSAHPHFEAACSSSPAGGAHRLCAAAAHLPRGPSTTWSCTRSPPGSILSADVTCWRQPLEWASARPAARRAHRSSVLSGACRLRGSAAHWRLEWQPLEIVSPHPRPRPSASTPPPYAALGAARCNPRRSRSRCQRALIMPRSCRGAAGLAGEDARADVLPGRTPSEAHVCELPHTGKPHGRNAIAHLVLTGLSGAIIGIRRPLPGGRTARALCAAQPGAQAARPRSINLVIVGGGGVVGGVALRASPLAAEGSAGISATRSSSAALGRLWLR